MTKYPAARRGGELDFETLARVTAGQNGNPVDVACPKCGPGRQSAMKRQRRVLRIWWKGNVATYKCIRCGVQGWAREAGSQADRPPAAQQHFKDDKEQRAKAERNRLYALEIWSEALPIVDTLAATYLSSRKLTFEMLSNVHAVLRFAPRCPVGREKHPAMLALLRDVRTDAPRAIQRTILTPEGNKVDRRTLGPKSGAAIKLWPDSEVEHGLVLAEGLETAMAAAKKRYKSTLLRPIWAAVDAGNLENFPVLAGIDALTIVVDNDESRRGQLAARTCALRYDAANRQVLRLMAREVGLDFNDLIMKESAKHAR
jgi:putative DNA primase/helicase